MLARETFNGDDMSVSWMNFLDWQKRQTSFASFAVWRGLTANLTGIEQPRRLNVRHVTWPLFSTLGVAPMLGRDFTSDDDRPGVPRTALVSHAFWQRELGGTAEALGRQIMLDEVPVTVIGVLPRDFTIARQEDIFLPVGTFLEGPVLQMYNGRGNHFGFARHRPLEARCDDGHRQHRDGDHRASVGTGIPGDQQRQRRQRPAVVRSAGRAMRGRCCTCCSAP